MAYDNQALPGGDKAPPADFEAEQAVLGAMLLEGDEVVRRVFGIVNSDDFYRTYHKDICAAIEACVRRKEPVDLITVSAELRRTKKLEEVGGGEYLTALIGEVPTAAHVTRYAGIVRECSLLRKYVAAAADIQRMAYDRPADIGQFVTEAENMLRDIARSGVKQRGALESMAEREETIMGMVAKAGQGSRGLSCARLGIPTIDEKIGPLSDHRIVLVKGGTGSGKTHIGINAVGSTARELKRTGDPGRIIVFSFESEGMYERRLLAWLCGQNNEDLRTGFDGTSQPDKWQDFFSAADELITLPIYLSEKRNDQAHIEEQWLEASREGPIALAVMDYWQAMKKKRGRAQIEEYQEATAIFRDLLDDTKTPGIITAQVTENQNQKSDAPGISKGSTDIQDAATMILRLHKDQSIVCEKMRLGPMFGRQKLHIDYCTSHIYSEEEWDAMQRRKSWQSYPSDIDVDSDPFNER